MLYQELQMLYDYPAFLSNQFSTLILFQKKHIEKNFIGFWL